MTHSSISQSLKHQLDSMIHSLATQSENYTSQSQDFTRNRKLNFVLETPTASAITKARNKIKIEAFKSLFYGTQSQETSNKTFKDFHL
ncbi:hypothetical protein OGZ51_06900 [Lactococcus lactis]|uniref:Uncharacterized protein n=1 Tax=Lactococcus lactis TaxID=1358 RepID=A0A9X4S846_9LACT|nr:hypothetical protein [Lactococcus lactis]MDG4983869.1 hypothetical protein [Lactococcus lactis]